MTVRKYKYWQEYIKKKNSKKVEKTIKNLLAVLPVYYKSSR